MGTYGSRSLAVGGSAIVKALDKIIAKGKKIAAHLLEAAEADIEFSDGKFTVAGTDRSKTFGEIALTAYVPHNYPLATLEPGLDETAFYDPTNFTYPAGTHICEVEVDPETGVVDVVAFSACDDFGNIINPMIVEGQVHGGVAQGLGQALLEHCVYDRDSGQLLTGSMMDYALPRADDLPSLKVATKVTPCTTLTFSNGTPRRAATTCANVVSCPCPWLCEPVKTVTLPVGCTRTSPASNNPARAPSAPAMLDGASPHASMYAA
jgi:carbon-monoxide dehydrogenase large subunit